MNANSSARDVRPGQRVRMFYDVSMVKSDVYRVVAVNDRWVMVSGVARASRWPRADFDRRFVAVVEE